MFKISPAFRKLLLLSAFAVSAVSASFSGDLALEAGFGAGFQGGPWSEEYRNTYEVLGLDAGVLFVPAFSAALVWKGPLFFEPVRLGIAGGLSLWSGSVGGRLDGELERAGSSLVFALEALPRLEAEFPLGSGALRIFLELGPGFAVGPLVNIDVLPGVRSVSRTPPDFFRRFLGITGLGVGYRTGSFTFLLKAQGSIADFDPEPDGPVFLGRLLLTTEYTLSRKEARR